MTSKELENYVLLMEQRLEDRVETVYKSHSNKWWIVSVVGLILFIVLFFTVFRKQPSTDESYKKEIQQLDSTIKYQQKTIDALNVYNESQDSLISNLNEKLKSNKTTETRIIHSYEKIPSDVRSYSKDSLRRAITEYQ
jgi:uncharacterized coiled-coil protein SlyX